jgi:hypothetical protein
LKCWVTKPGGRIAFSTWPFEIVNGKLVKAMAKHMPANTTTSIYSSNQSEPQQQPPSPMQGVNPDTIQKLLNGLNKDAIIDIHFEREVVKIPLVLSPNHYWTRTSTKSDLVIQAIQAIKEPSKIKALEIDVLKDIAPYYKDNELLLVYH